MSRLDTTQMSTQYDIQLIDRVNKKCVDEIKCLKIRKAGDSVRARVCVCKWVLERKRERESRCASVCSCQCVCVRESVCVCASVCVFCACVCVCFVLERVIASSVIPPVPYKQQYLQWKWKFHFKLKRGHTIDFQFSLFPRIFLSSMKHPSNIFFRISSNLITTCETYNQLFMKE